VLVIVDPLSQFLGAGSQEPRVRRVLTGVKRMAERRGVALVAIRHLAKERFAAQLAGLGSVAIGAVARSGLLLAPDPADTGEVILAQYKNNLAPQAKSLRLHFDGVRLISADECTLLPSDLVRPTTYNEHSALGEAMSFLQATLSEGSVRVARVGKLAANAGVKHRTLRKAKDALGVQARKSEGAFDGPWYWRLPGDERIAPDPEDAPRTEGHLLQFLCPVEEDEPSPNDDSHDAEAPTKAKGPTA
jgi:hypothetical protein